MQRQLSITGAALAVTTLLATAQPAKAVSVVVSERLANGQQINSTTNPVFSGTNTASTTFTYMGQLIFSNKSSPTQGVTSDLNAAFFTNPVAISGYTGSGTVAFNGATVANYSTLAGLQGSSASAYPFQYASYYQFDLGVLTAGTTLTFTHDDGASVYQGSTRVGSTVFGATQAVTDHVTVISTDNTALRYTRQNITPSVLPTEVPEPMSIGLLGAGLAGLGLIRRRKHVV